MVDFVYSLMTDRRKGAIWLPLKAVLYLLSLAYGLAISVRGVLYWLRIFRSQKVPLKVVSVGNITLGGTGKTPFTIALANILEHELKRSTTVLLRGYGWDEQALLKKSLPDIPVLVGEDRVRSAHKAIRLYGSQFAVLDDGFQYWELKRDLNIVLVDSRNPFGNGFLFPRGTLREPMGALKRADVIVFTKIDKKRPDLSVIKNGIGKINRSAIFLEAMHKPSHIYDPKARKDRELSFMSGKRVMLVSGIGDPLYFEDTIKGLGAAVLDHVVFGDHHDYKAKDIEKIVKMCGVKTPDFLVTTEKDAVKFARMSFSFGKNIMMTLVIHIDITSGREQLIDRLRSLRTG